MVQSINGIVINDILLNDIRQVVNEKNINFTTYDLFIILQKYLRPKDIMTLLNIGKTSYYNYKKNKKLLLVDRALYDLYISIEF